MTDTHAFKHERRIRLTDHERAKLFLEHKGKCHNCTRKMGPADAWIVEHLIALSNGGTNDWKNLCLTCPWCVPAKNAEDAAKAAKTRAIATAHIVPSSLRQKKGRPLPGSKRSGWKHKVSGEWVRREDQ